MEETPAADVKPASNAPTVGQGCSLIAGGAALGFFGCLGAFAAGSEVLAFVFLFLGAILWIYGLFRLGQVMWRAMSRPLDHGKD